MENVFSIPDNPIISDIDYAQIYERGYINGYNDAIKEIISQLSQQHALGDFRNIKQYNVFIGKDNGFINSGVYHLMFVHGADKTFILYNINGNRITCDILPDNRIDTVDYLQTSLSRAVNGDVIEMLVSTTEYGQIQLKFVVLKE